jgi:hypothetical protein
MVVPLPVVSLALRPSLSIGISLSRGVESEKPNIGGYRSTANPKRQSWHAAARDAGMSLFLADSLLRLLKLMTSCNEKFQNANPFGIEPPRMM